jgi:chromosome segregation ATPase
MAKYQDAINDLVWLEKKFSGLVAIIPQLRDLANLESVNATLQAQKDTLSKEVSGLSSDVQAAKDAIRDQKKDQEALLRKYDKAVSDASIAAEAKSNEIIAEATSGASKIVANAEAEAKRFAAQAAEAKKALGAIVAEIADKQKVLDDLNSKLLKLKESL